MKDILKNRGFSSLWHEGVHGWGRIVARIFYFMYWLIANALAINGTDKGGYGADVSRAGDPRSIRFYLRCIAGMPAIQSTRWRKSAPTSASIRAKVKPKA